MLPLEIALRDMEQIEDENVTHLVRFVRGSRRGFTREPRLHESAIAAPAGTNDESAPDLLFA